MHKKSAYLIGIKGVAMTALATYLHQKGYLVSGSDVGDEFQTDSVLKAQGIQVKIGFHAANVDRRAEFVVVTGAHGGMTNPEAKEAQKLGLSTLMHGKFLGSLMDGKFGISVAGCHGKTTTSAIIASLFTNAGLKPSYSVGAAQINDLGYAGHYGTGKYFIAEADEYMTCPMTDRTPRFLWQRPKLLVITNIDYDHPDAFDNIEEIKTAFIQFANNMSDDSLVVICQDDRNAVSIMPFLKNKVYTYGFSPKSDYRIEKIYFGDGLSSMRVSFQKTDLGDFIIHIPGRHNLLNSLAASVAANLLGLSWVDIKENLKKFRGTRRRFEKISNSNNMLLYDDYAHHPSEIKSTLESFKNWFPGRRLIVIFQPHTYSRTKALLSDFAGSFLDADMVIFTDIYPSAREKFDNSISSKILMIEANKYKKNANYYAGKIKILSFLKDNLKSGDLIVMMGAGDIFSWQKDFINLMKNYASP